MKEHPKLISSSFDVIGSKEKVVAIVEIPDELNSKKFQIAEEIMKSNKNIKSVLMKKTGRKGELRLREYELIAGDKDTEVVYKEFGYLLKLDPQKVYFSPRESTERQRIADQVKPNEIIMLMFGGIAGFALAIVKKQPLVKRIYSVELNPEAHNYATENIRINKVSHLVVPILGNVREVCEQFFGICNRVIMPLPLGAENFLDIAIKCLKKNGIIHFYNWGGEKDLYGSALKLIDDKLKSLKKKYEIIDKRKVLPYSPRRWKICIDIKVK